MDPPSYFSGIWAVPFNCPVHCQVCDQQRRNPVEELVARAAEGVEDSGGYDMGGRIQSIGGQAVCNDVLLRLGA